MKKIYLPFIILIVGVILSTLVVLFFNSNSVIGNGEILQEINRINNIPYKNVIYDSLTSEDFNRLVELTKGDFEARSFITEAIWLAEHNEPKHVGHALYFLEQYVKTGEDEICIPHELTHIRIYLDHEDFKLAEAQRRVADKYKKGWLTRVKKQYEKFPQFYPKFDELLNSIDEVLIRLKNKQYGKETMKLLEFIEKYEVC